MMNRTYREIIDNFMPPLASSFPAPRLLPGTFTGEVPGYVGLLTRQTAKSQVLTFSMPRWDAHSVTPNPSDTVVISIRPLVEFSTWADQAAEDAYFNSGTNLVFMVTDVPNPYVVMLPESVLPTGVWLLRAEVTIADSGVTNRTVPQLLIIDETAPYEVTSDRPPAPSVPAGVTVPLDRNYFQNQPNQTVEFPIPYDQTVGRSPGDSLLVYFGSSQQPIATIAIDPTVPSTVPLTLTAIQNELRGNYELSYRLRDVSGNVSEQSYSLTLADLDLAAVPDNFQPPVVLLAVPGDLLIHLGDVVANNGAIVQVPSYTNANAGDVINVTLTSANGTVVSLMSTVGPTPFPIPFNFTPADMAALYGTATGNVGVTVSYTVVRGANSYPATPITVQFDLNLTVVGPTPNPNPPGPGGINIDLPLAIVEAIRPGNLFGPPNNLEAVDVNRDARVRIPLWTAPPLPATQLPITYTFFYGGNSYTEVLTAIPATQEVVFRVPFSEILRVGGPTHDVYYTVSRPGNPNPQRSDVTTVIVDSAIMVMDAPTFPDIVPLAGSGFRNASCTSLRPVNTGSLRLTITGSPYLSPGQPVTLTYTGFQNNTTAPPSVWTFTRTVTVPSVNAGVVGFTVDLGTAVDLYNPVITGRAFLSSASATVVVSTQYQGQTVSSLPATVRVRGYVPGNGVSSYCTGGVIP